MQSITVQYEEGSGWFLLYNGMEWGPFDKIEYIGDKYSLVERKNKYYILINGEDDIYGPIDKVFKYTENYVFFGINDQNFLMYQNRIFPVDNIINFDPIIYLKDGYTFIIINDTINGPYDDIYNYTRYWFIFEKDFAKYLWLNGHKYGPYAEVSYAKDFEGFIMRKRGQIYYIHESGKYPLYGPFNDIIKALKFNYDELYLIIKEESNLYILNVCTGDKYGHFDDIIKFLENYKGSYLIVKEKSDLYILDIHTGNKMELEGKIKDILLRDIDSERENEGKYEQIIVHYGPYNWIIVIKTDNKVKVYFNKDWYEFDLDYMIRIDWAFTNKRFFVIRSMAYKPGYFLTLDENRQPQIIEAQWIYYTFADVIMNDKDYVLYYNEGGYGNKMIYWNSKLMPYTDFKSIEGLDVYEYRDEEGKYYLYHYGKLLGPYSEIYHYPENDFYKLKDETGVYYLYYRNNLSGPYDNVEVHYVADSDIKIMHYKKDNRWFVKIGDTIEEFPIDDQDQSSEDESFSVRSYHVKCGEDNNEKEVIIVKILHKDSCIVRITDQGVVKILQKSRFSNSKCFNSIDKCLDMDGKFLLIHKDTLYLPDGRIIKPPRIDRRIKVNYEVIVNKSKIISTQFMVK